MKKTLFYGLTALELLAISTQISAQNIPKLKMENYNNPQVNMIHAIPTVNNDWIYEHPKAFPASVSPNDAPDGWDPEIKDIDFLRGNDPIDTKKYLGFSPIENLIANSITNKVGFSSENSYDLVDTKPDANGNYHFKATNIGSTLSGLANLVDIPFDNADEYALTFLKSKGFTSLNNDNIKVETIGEEYTDLKAVNTTLTGKVSKVAVKNRCTWKQIFCGTCKPTSYKYVKGKPNPRFSSNGHIKIFEGETIAVNADMLGLDGEYFSQFSSLDGLEKLNGEMKSVYNSLTVAVSNSELDLKEVQTLNAQITDLNMFYEAIVGGLEKVLAPGDFTRVVNSYNTLSEYVENKFDQITEKANRRSHKKIVSPNSNPYSGFKTPSWGDQAKVSGFVGVKTLIEGQDYVSLGVEFGNKDLLLGMGAIATYSELSDSTEMQFKDKINHDGSKDFMYTLKNTTSRGIGGYLSLNKTLIENAMKIGVDYLFVPMNHTSEITKVEGQQSLYGSESNRTQLPNEVKTEFDHLVGLNLSYSPCIRGVEPRLGFGAFYNIKNGKTFFGFHAGVGIGNKR